MTTPHTIEALLDGVPDYSAFPDLPKPAPVPLSPELQYVVDNIESILAPGAPLQFDVPSGDTDERHSLDRIDPAAARAALLQRLTWTRDATIGELCACGLPEDDVRVMRYRLFCEVFPHARRRAEPQLQREFVRLSSGAQYARRVDTPELRRQRHARDVLRSIGTPEHELPALDPHAPPSAMTETHEQRRARIEAMVDAGLPCPSRQRVRPGERGHDAQMARAVAAQDALLYREVERERRAAKHTAYKLDVKAARSLAKQAAGGDREAERELRLHEAVTIGAQSWGERAIADLASIGRQKRDVPVASRHLQAATPMWQRRHGSP